MRTHLHQFERTRIVQTQASQQERSDAQTALTKYESLVTQSDRMRFLRAFTANGGGKGPGALKFVFSFTGSIVHQEDVVMGNTEDYYSVGEILGQFGKSLSDFSTPQQALEDAQYIVAKNLEENGCDSNTHPPQIDNERPEYSKLWFIKSDGKKTSWLSRTKKELTGEADNLKDIKAIEEGLTFMEGIGYGNGDESTGTTITSVKFAELQSLMDTLGSLDLHILLSSSKYIYIYICFA